MKLFNILILLFFQFSQFKCQLIDSNGIPLYDKLEEMEKIMLEETSLEAFVEPCTSFFTGDPLSGELTAAEWVRIVFHDAITGNTAAGTGGLDASIGFESNRPENTGLHFINDTFDPFRNFFSVYTSMADVIALGLAVSLIECDPNPRLINLRVGRKDATAAGPSGVPQPQDSTATQFAAFAKIGFNQTDSIAAVACGHSLGAVHAKDFPDIVPVSMETSTNLDGGATFDSTPAVFDNTGVTEYLTGTGLKGGPLVTSFNVSMRSDLRLFESDNNATLNAMKTPTTFRNRCLTIFERLLNTVPSGVVLSDVVVPRTWTMTGAALDLLSNGLVSYSGTLVWNSATVSQPNTATYVYTTTGGGNTGPHTVPVSLSFSKVPYGAVTNYVFNDTITTPTVTGISVTNGAYTAPINLNFFLLVSRSAVNFGGSPSGGAQWLLRVALLSTLSPTGLSVTIFSPTNQQGSTAQKILSTTTPSMTFKSTLGSYKIYEAVVNLDGSIQANAGRTFLRVNYGSATARRVDGNVQVRQCSTVPITNC